MPPNRSAEKRVVQSEKRALRNAAIKSRTKTAVRRFREAVQRSDEVEIKERLRQAVRQLDKAVTRGVLHDNAAARTKSRLYKLAQSKVQ